MNQLSSKASLFLLISSIGSFLVLIVFKAEYYHTIFLLRFYDSLAWVVGGSIAFLVEFVRFSLMISSAYDAKRSKWLGFMLGLGGSIALVVYEFYLCGEVGAIWDKESLVYTNILKFLVSVGLLLELRLCLLISGKSSNSSSSSPSGNDQEEKAPKDKAPDKSKSINLFPFNGLPQDKSNLNSIGS